MAIGLIFKDQGVAEKKGKEMQVERIRGFVKRVGIFSLAACKVGMVRKKKGKTRKKEEKSE